jgi:hypothetical protein
MLVTVPQRFSLRYDMKSFAVIRAAADTTPHQAVFALPICLP